jgi:hypothetical protein
VDGVGEWELRGAVDGVWWQSVRQLQMRGGVDGVQVSIACSIAKNPATTAHNCHCLGLLYAATSAEFPTAG